MRLQKVMMRVAREHGELGWGRWSGSRQCGLISRVGRGGEVFIGIGVGIGMGMQAYVYANKANIEFFFFFIFYRAWLLSWRVRDVNPIACCGDGLCDV